LTGGLTSGDAAFCLLASGRGAFGACAAWVGSG